MEAFILDIAQQLFESIQQYGAPIEINTDQSLRLSHADHVPDALIIQIKQFKAKIIQYLQQCAVSDLIEEIAQQGASMELLEGGQLRLHHANYLPDELLQRIRQNKLQIVAHLTPCIESKQPQQMQTHSFELQILQVFFDRLDRKRQNLKKIRGDLKNALVTPKDYIGDLMGKFGIHQYQAQNHLDMLIDRGILTYDSRFKFYLFPNYQHPSLHAFSHYDIEGCLATPLHEQ